MMRRMRIPIRLLALCALAVLLLAPAAAQPPVSRCPAGMVLVEGGSFVMGRADSDSDQRPNTKATISAFCLDRTEVTVAGYRACSDAGACLPAWPTVDWTDIEAGPRAFWSQFCNGARNDRENHPVNCETWSQAAAFCRWRQGRLPTEAEWEFAARGPEARLHPWGSRAAGPRLLNACGEECRRKGLSLGAAWPTMHPDDDGWSATAPVGSFPAGATPQGLMDLSGNVFEWVADWYGPYPGGAVADPKGPAQGAYRVTRGGAWTSWDAGRVHAAIRGRGEPGLRNHIIGFRCAAAPRAQ